MMDQTAPARLIFMGTSAFAVPILNALVHAAYDIAYVITQPDRPQGRHRKIKPTPIHVAADSFGLPVFQPDSIRMQACFDMLDALAPDIIITASYGQILRQRHLDIPRFGILNVHASLLPDLRGPAPIQWAILQGKTITGVTIMKTELGIDTGPILSQDRLPIRLEDTADSLEARIAERGAALLIETLPKYLSGTLHPVPQNNAEATLTRMIRTEDGRIDWTLPAEQIARHIRAMHPAPGAFTICHHERLKIYSAGVDDDAAHDPMITDRTTTPGTILDGINGSGLLVQTGRGRLLIHELQPACRKCMAAESLLQGRFAERGDVLGSTQEGHPLPCLE
ncbi:methionyl-tRNA formyltransferase [bacterium]|nr:methionyl-tRNA formyltransferase [candidate division CSSED10-310 bacterium]